MSLIQLNHEAYTVQSSLHLQLSKNSRFYLLFWNFSFQERSYKSFWAPPIISSPWASKASENPRKNQWPYFAAKSFGFHIHPLIALQVLLLVEPCPAPTSFSGLRVIFLEASEVRFLAWLAGVDFLQL